MAGTVAAGLHASRDSLYRTLTGTRQPRPGVNVFPLALLPRRCPHCGNKTIVGHGRRRKQAHDQRHDWIWVRRGRCPPCRKTYTIVPAWSPPYGHYSFHCRRDAWESVCAGRGSWEQPAPSLKDPDRLPDPTTLRRWACRRLLSLWGSLAAFWSRQRCQDFLRAPTILAWDWPAASRNLCLEVNFP